MMNMKQEMIDVLDANGRKTGSVRPKRYVHLHGLWHAAAHIWIYNSKGEILLQKRAKMKESYPELWDVSAAGHISAGESPKHALLREMKEEIGIIAKPESIKKLMVVKAEDEISPVFHKKEFDYVYLLKFDGKIRDLKLQVEEVERIEFFPIAKLEKELKNPKTVKRYVPHGDYYFKIIAAVRKELGK